MGYLKNYRGLDKNDNLIRQCADANSKYVLRVWTQDPKVAKITENGIKIWGR